MVRTEQDRLKVEEAKKKLKQRSGLGAGPSRGLRVVGTAMDGAKRQPFRAAAVAFALGVAIGYSSRTRRAAVYLLRKTLGSGV